MSHLDHDIARIKNTVVGIPYEKIPKKSLPITIIAHLFHIYFFI